MALTASYKEGDLFRSFFGTKDISNLISRAKRLPTSRNNYRTYIQSNYQKIELPRRNDGPYHEYELLHRFVDHEKYEDNMVYGILTHLRGILEENYLTDLDTTLDDLPSKEKFANLSVKYSDLKDDYKFFNWQRDEMRLWANLCASLGKIFYPEDTHVNAKLIFSEIPRPEVQETTVTIETIVTKLLKISADEIEGRRSRTPVEKGSWLMFTLDRYLAVANGVGCVTTSPYRSCLTLKGLWIALANYYDLNQFKTTQQREEFLNLEEVKSAFLIFFSSQYYSQLPVVQPLKLSELSRVPQYYSLVDTKEDFREIATRLRSNVLEDDDMVAIISTAMSLIIVRANKTRWTWCVELMLVSLIIYYSIFKTSRTRVVKRDKLFRLTLRGKALMLDFSQLEIFFDNIQNDVKNFSVRRAFVGSLGQATEVTLFHYDGKFPNMWLDFEQVPWYSKYNVDYFKYLNNNESRVLRYNTKYLTKSIKYHNSRISGFNKLRNFYDKKVTTTRIEDFE